MVLSYSSQFLINQPTWYCGGRDDVAADRGGGHDAEAKLCRDGGIVEKEATLVGREGELYGRIRFARDDGSLIRVRLCKREGTRFRAQNIRITFDGIEITLTISYNLFGLRSDFYPEALTVRPSTMADL